MNIPEMNFPAPDSLPEGCWQPIYFRPNLDSPERLVIGIVAKIGKITAVVRANALDRLRCLYGNDYVLASELIDLGLSELEHAIEFGEQLADISQVVSGLSIGKPRSAQAFSANELATSYLSLTSSLHDPKKVRFSVELASVQTPSIDPIDREISRDRLPVLVMTQVSERAPQAKKMFNQHILRLENDDRARLLTHKAYVAFNGKNVSANFATIKAGRQKSGVDVSKRLMWDLEQVRESDASLLPRHSYEMILYHPRQDDPTITARQYENVMEVVETLEAEGANREINVKAFEGVPEIAQHILAVEELL